MRWWRLPTRPWAAQLGLPIRLLTYDATACALCQPGRRTHLLPVALAAPALAGTLDVRNARYVLATVEQAAQGCLLQEFDAVVSAPVQKSVSCAGVAFSGHTEFFQEKAGAPRVVMMLACPGRAWRWSPRTCRSGRSDPPSRRNCPMKCWVFWCTTCAQGSALPHHVCWWPGLIRMPVNPAPGAEEMTPLFQRYRVFPTKTVPAWCCPPTPCSHRNTSIMPMGTSAMYHDQGLPVLKYKGLAMP